MTNKTKRILGTICFSCCEPPKFPWMENMSVRKGKHPKLGEKVELNGACGGIWHIYQNTMSRTCS